MPLKIPKLWRFLELTKDDPQGLHDLDVSLDSVYQELYRELEVADSQMATNIAAIAANAANIATNVTNIGTNVTNIGTNVSAIAALGLRIDDLESQAGLNIDTYGAVGDDSTDNLTAVQDAIDALPANGGDVAVPEGIYRVSNSLTLGPNDRLVGMGDEASILKFTHTTTDGINLPNTNLGWGIRDLKILSTRVTRAGSAIDGSAGASYGRLKNVKVQGYWDKGLGLNNCVGNKFDGLEIGEAGGPAAKDKTYGINLWGTSHFNKFTNCVVRNTNSHCVFITQGDANTFINCEVGYTSKVSVIYGYVMQANAHRNKIIHSWAEDLDVGWVVDAGGTDNVITYVYTADCTTDYIDNGTDTKILVY